ncbi:hypothetical protein ACTXOR_16135, partial [Arthrobacter rhombi]|uniref:hypothetical protein n=1 Tax=Arthrobacter rhombi TaxID=71253 RepID=UPI003FCF4280
FIPLIQIVSWHEFNQPTWAVQLAHAGAPRKVSVPHTGTLGGCYAETGTRIDELHDVFLSGRCITMQQILDHAVARDEVDPDEVADSSVEEIFLPLVLRK